MASLVHNLLRPAYVARRIRELGPRRVAQEFLVKRLGLKLERAGPAIRSAQLAARPLAHLRRRRAARDFVRRHGNPLAIGPAGFRRVAAGAIPGADGVLALGQRLLRERAALLDRHPDSYGLNLLADDGLVWTKGVLDLTPYDILLDFALAPPIVAAVSAYFGELPVLEGIELYCTTTKPTLEGNNLFHFDAIDATQVKVWMAVTEITEESGPLTFIPADKSAPLRGRYGRLSDAEVEAAVPRREHVAFTGRPGDMLFIDTCRCAHFGSRTRKGPRAMWLFQYQRAAAWSENEFYFHPVRYNAGRYAGNEAARLLFVRMRETARGKID